LVPDWPREAKEVPQDIVTYLGKDGLGMKLDALHYILSVSHAHYRSFRSLRRHFQTGRKLLSFDDQRVVTCGLERIGQAPINGPAIVVDGRGFAMDGRCPTDLSPVDMAYALMTQTHAQ
jgi:hypothetical protein